MKLILRPVFVNSSPPAQRLALLVCKFYLVFFGVLFDIYFSLPDVRKILHRHLWLPSLHYCTPHHKKKKKLGKEKRNETNPLRNGVVKPLLRKKNIGIKKALCATFHHGADDVKD